MSGTAPARGLIEEQTSAARVATKEESDLIALEAGNAETAKQNASGPSALEIFVAEPSVETLMAIPYIIPIGALVLLFIIL